MRICHVSPHLPPDQAANALLPAQLGAWQRARGDDVCFVAHESSQTAGAPLDPLAGPVSWIPRRAADGLARRLRLDALRLSRRIHRTLDADAAAADLLHLHSNGLIVEAAAAWARRRDLPCVLTLYGTEIWHYQRRRPVDRFARAYRGASQVTFYSRQLLERAQAIGLDRAGLSVTYPAVTDLFFPRHVDSRRALRQQLQLGERFVFLNVKRLHTLAAHDVLIEAFGSLARGRSDVRLVICGRGPLRAQIEAQIRRLGLDSQVRLTGLIPNAEVARYMAAADAFVLPSRLEALPTVAVEALASGMPVISGDHPGGVELSAMFPDDITLVARDDTDALARAMAEFMNQPRRVSDRTLHLLEERFRPSAVLASFDAVYARAGRPA